MRHPLYGLGLTKKQKDLFEQICVGNYSPNGKPKDFEALLNWGCIRQCGEKVICRDRFGTVAVPEYEAEISYHAAFCAWADEHLEDPTPTPSQVTE